MSATAPSSKGQPAVRVKHEPGVAAPVFNTASVQADNAVDQKPAFIDLQRQVSELREGNEYRHEQLRLEKERRNQEQHCIQKLRDQIADCRCKTLASSENRPGMSAAGDQVPGGSTISRRSTGRMSSSLPQQLSRERNERSKETEKRKTAELEAQQLRQQTVADQVKINALEAKVTQLTAQLESNVRLLSKKDESFDALSTKEQAAAAKIQDLERALDVVRKEKADTERHLKDIQAVPKSERDDLGVSPKRMDENSDDIDAVKPKCENLRLQLEEARVRIFELQWTLIGVKVKRAQENTAREAAKNEGGEKLDEAHSTNKDLGCQCRYLLAQLKSEKEENSRLNQQVATLSEQLSESRGVNRVYKEETIPMLQQELDKLHAKYDKFARAQLQHAHNVAANATNSAPRGVKPETLSCPLSNGTASGSPTDGDSTTQSQQASTDMTGRHSADATLGQPAASHQQLPTSQAAPPGSECAMNGIRNAWSTTFANGEQGPTRALGAMPPTMMVTSCGSVPSPLQHGHSAGQMPPRLIYRRMQQFPMQHYVPMTPQQQAMAAQHRQMFHVPAEYPGPVFQGPPAVHVHQPPQQQGPSNAVATIVVSEPSSSGKGLAAPKRQKRTRKRDPSLPIDEEDKQRYAREQSQNEPHQKRQA